MSFSLLFVITCLGAALAVAWGEPGPKWLRDTLNGLLLSLVASGVFALFSIGYVAYFLDPGAERDKIVVLPQDLKGEMDRIATEAKDYKIYVVQAATSVHIPYEGSSSEPGRQGARSTLKSSCSISAIIKCAICMHDSVKTPSMATCGA